MLQLLFKSVNNGENGVCCIVSGETCWSPRSGPLPLAAKPLWSGRRFQEPSCQLPASCLTLFFGVPPPPPVAGVVICLFKRSFVSPHLSF